MEKMKKIGRHWDLNPEPMGLKGNRLLHCRGDLHINKSQECVLPIFNTKVEITNS
jgi:hypothetical protein